MVMEAKPRNQVVTALLLFAGLPLLAVALLRTIGYDGGGWYLTALLSLAPYVAVYGALLGALALLLRRWWIGGFALAMVALLAVFVLPRVLADDQPEAHGATVRVMSANLYLGEADPVTVVRLVRENRVDVLNLLEMTPAAVSGLEKAGLFQELRYRVLHPASGASGSGIVSRFPLTEEDYAGDSAAKQPGAEADLGGGLKLEVVAVHPRSPDVGFEGWEQELRDLSRAIGEHGLRVLAGDFNATLDHAALRTVLSRGYVDAAATRGDGLDPTWPATMVPFAPLDHVLVDRRVAVRDYRVLDVPGTDHHAVYAEVQLP
ncbi:endonuclease/exonuclease/phosphatase family protein [Amycolatopsis jiangsuensis]|uniref:Endonuclease/exonuclease/phosphatase (EEP) superfamily protein YafD n=1 Tax=Amycolatopsis jiangsuensis TaxID=1181879 RepID=A0A840J1L5_9PSEU|nr:endonuclease/exonuclease/phosphatase family protein [Amycolatopsis jiangsuensis]MBB4687813.1 endonuclease/exonuclease/phosphatase (EEP) superfamily protein YafD [Amycolatopsis jiangsuensis]